MENQHQKIAGYRDLDQEEINLMNQVKEVENHLGDVFDELERLPSIDLRWLSIGRTTLQQGFMATVRAIAKPVSNLNPLAKSRDVPQQFGAQYPSEFRQEDSKN